MEEKSAAICGTVMQVHQPRVLLRNVPRIEWLIEFPRICKHGFHVRDTGNIPVANGLVECNCQPKHGLHVAYIGRVPTTNVSIERHTAMKHAAHIGHIRHIPRGNVAIELSASVKHSGHVGDMGCIPSRQINIHPRVSEQTGHVRDMRRIPFFQWTKFKGNAHDVLLVKPTKHVKLSHFVNEFLRNRVPWQYVLFYRAT